MADDPSLKSISCFLDPYYVVVGKVHPFHVRKHLSFAELDKQAFIFPDSSMDVYQHALQQLFEYYHVTIHSSICCSSVRSVLHMVSQNLGIAILTRLVTESDDLDIIPLEGKSLVPIFKTGHREGHDYLGFEHYNERAFLSNDGWKLVRPGEKAKWELYNLNEDRSEMHNLAAQYPEKVAEMTKAYEAWAKRCMVEPYPGQKKK